MPPLKPVSASPRSGEGRFATSPATLLVDRLMTIFIVCGGMAVIAAVSLIFVFIFKEIAPLFRGATVTEVTSAKVTLPPADYRILGFDEWGELPFTVDDQARLTFIDVTTGTVAEPQPILAEGDGRLSSCAYDHRTQAVIIGTDTGHLTVGEVGYTAALDAADQRVVAGTFAKVLDVDLGTKGHPLVAVDYADGGSRKLAAAIQDQGDSLHVLATTLEQRRGLMGGGKITPGIQADLTADVAGSPRKVLVNDAADSVIVVSEAGEISFFFLQGDAFVLRQRFTPFPDSGLATIDWLLGDVSLVCTSTEGANTIWSLYLHDIPDEQAPPRADGTRPMRQERRFGPIKAFDALPGSQAGTWYANSIRNKAYLIGGGTGVSLRYATTQTVRWEGDLGYPTVLGAINGKYSRFAALDTSNALHVYDIRDPHPESGVRSFFGKQWYEGAAQPSFEWQSTGGTDDFEPKLSLIPLIIGSLKGTFYALLFAVPIALIGALYASEFMRPEFKRVVKPMLELMASLPSVVLGFLAALWLAPLIEDQVPTLVCAIALIPTLALVFGLVWSRLPRGIQTRVPRGWEFLALFPVLALAVVLAMGLGPAVEWLVCRVPITNEAGEVTKIVHDFRLWWPWVTDTPFEQRNSLVVGFIMGFAVIPIIFTISEDSLSAVPPALRSGSLALGASRWQTALNIVLPTAAAGIFSAVMIGFGRAVGETMIVVMATGNTPIMDFNIFSGMRTLSANIAVELPEAPHHSTLYRTLFLGAMVLFLLTFAVNTVAEVLRQYLRERYKTV